MHTPTSSLNTQILLFSFFFFWSCYSTSLNIENTVATSNQFFCFKNYPSYYYINSFSLLRIFFSLILSVSHIIQTQNTKQNPILKIKLNQNKQLRKKEKKKEKKKERNNKPIWPSLVVGRTTSGGRVEDERRRQSGRHGGTESGAEGTAKRSHLTHLFFLRFLLQRKLDNVLESSRKI